MKSCTKICLLCTSTPETTQTMNSNNVNHKHKDRTLVTLTKDIILIFKKRIANDCEIFRFFLNAKLHHSLIFFKPGTAQEVHVCLVHWHPSFPIPTPHHTVHKTIRNIPASPTTQLMAHSLCISILDEGM